jgi:peptidoglycan/xylan/chitin deacetylase (PgdA/CDA1 family)
VLTFHRVLAQADPFEGEAPDTAAFTRQLEWLARQFRILPLSQACRQLKEGTLPARCAAISIDDGYRDNLELALPVLQRLGLPATVFVATGFVHGRSMFNDRIAHALRTTRRKTIDLGPISLGRFLVESTADKMAALPILVNHVKYLNLAKRESVVTFIEERCETDPPPALMMSVDDLNRLQAGGVELGGHTRNHPILRLLSDEEALDEIRGSRDDLLVHCGKAPSLFAFPNGKRMDDYDQRHCALVRQAGYEFAFTTQPGSSCRTTDPFEMPRFSTWPGNRLQFGLRLVRNLMGG